MGILDWFKNRPGQYDPDRAPAELVDWGIDKAIALTNPRLKLLPGCQKKLAPAVATTIEFLRARASSLPAVHALSAKDWTSDAALRAFFVAPADITAALGTSDNLRTFFSKFPEIDAACVVLGMAFKEQRVFGMALHGEMVQRDVAQTSISFSDHRTRLCGHDEARLRRVVGVEVFEYLLAHALAQIGEERDERRELQETRALIRARLRLLQQHGPGLGSMFGGEPAAQGEQQRLSAELQENERQLEALGSSQSVLENELEILISVLEAPESVLRFDARHLRVNTMNIVLDATSPERAAEIDFAVADLSGTPPVRRAFVLAHVARSEIPPPQKLKLDDAARYL
jgi:hypothetical protein